MQLERDEKRRSGLAENAQLRRRNWRGATSLVEFPLQDKLPAVVRSVEAGQSEWLWPEVPAISADIRDEEDSRRRTFKVEEDSHQGSRYASLGIAELPAETFSRCLHESPEVLCRCS